MPIQKKNKVIDTSTCLSHKTHTEEDQNMTMVIPAWTHRQYMANKLTYHTSSCPSQHRSSHCPQSQYPSCSALSNKVYHLMPTIRSHTLSKIQRKNNSRPYTQSACSSKSEHTKKVVECQSFNFLSWSTSVWGSHTTSYLAATICFSWEAQSNQLYDKCHLSSNSFGKNPKLVILSFFCRRKRERN